MSIREVLYFKMDSRIIQEEII